MMTTSAAAELLRGYAAPGTPLAACRAAAERATYRGRREDHERVQQAVQVLELDQ